jgi:signal transduction histidine kinase
MSSFFFRLTPRLVVAFGLTAALSVAGLGAIVREDRRQQESARFDREVKSVCTRVEQEIRRQAESDARLVAGACKEGELVDRTFVAMEAGQLDMRRLALARLVPEERAAFGFDEMMLATDQGDVLGADPKSLLSRADVQAGLRADAGAWLRLGAKAALVARCKRVGQGGHAVGLVAARYLDPILDRLGSTLHLDVSVGSNVPIDVADVSVASCPLTDVAGTTAPIVVSKSRRELRDALARIDQSVLLAGLGAVGFALVVALVLARWLGRPLAELSAEAQKVARGDARPLRTRGSGEIGDLVATFNTMIHDLGDARRRLAAADRVAAWREVARRVAHEVKNPLAPIRAAVETLRRLRARDDPAFDEYFDEATRTVLDEVHRISNIVTEFTRFARLPPPRPSDVDLLEVVRDVVQLQKAAAGSATIDVVVERVPPIVRADRDQIVQVLTNLVQNAIDAVEKKGKITVTLAGEADVATITVSDDGPGIAPEMEARLFEPYATTKAQGTGLGLAIAQRIAMDHGGELASIGRGRGATFRLALPLSGPPSSDAPSSAD